MDDPPEVIMISGHGTIETAVRATKLGAYDFAEKPLSLEKTLILVKNAIDARRLRHENLDLRKQLQSKSVIVGDSVPMKALRQQIGLMAPTNGRVLIYGESGTGKELVAHAIHMQSLRKDEDVCGDQLRRDSRGPDRQRTFWPSQVVVSRSDGGQGRQISEGRSRNVVSRRSWRHEPEDAVQSFAHAGAAALLSGGQRRSGTVDVRVIASTNKDLEEEIAKGNFREDLFYRFNVIPFVVPPLRERKEDIPLLARHFLKEFASAYGRRPREITDDAVDSLMRYAWPGNVRELRNVIERIVIMNPTTSRFERKHLPPLVHRDGSRRVGGHAKARRCTRPARPTSATTS